MKIAIGPSLTAPPRPPAGGSSGPPPLAAGVNFGVLGDSGYARGDTFTATLWEHKSAGPHHWAAALSGQRVRCQTWYDATATAANLVPAYGDGSATSPLYRGANLGLSGDTATGTLKRTPQMRAAVGAGGLIWYRAGSNVGSTDALASTTIAAIQSAIGALSAGGRYVVVETILPRRVSLAPTGYDLSTAEMARIIAINDAIRANWASWGAIALSDPWDLLRDPAYGPADALYGTGLPAYFIADGAHPSSLGAYTLGKFNAGIIRALVSEGRWFTRNSGGLFTNWNLTGASGTIGASCSGQAPSSLSIQNTAGAGQPVTAASSVAANAETGGQTWTIVVSSAGGGAANAFQEIRISSTGVTTGFTSTDYFSFIPDIEIDGGAALGCFQLSTGTGSTVSARGIGQMGMTSGSSANEYYPVETAMALEPDTAPLLVDTRTSLVARLHLFVRTDVVGSATIRIKRWRMPLVTNPQVQFPWVP